MIEPGTVGTVRMATIGVVNGEEAIVVEHVSRMAPDLAPHWPAAPRDGTYRILVDGEPSVSCDLVIGADDDAASDSGMEATTMRIVNSIPAVSLLDEAVGVAPRTFGRSKARIGLLEAARGGELDGAVPD